MCARQQRPLVGHRSVPPVRRRQVQPPKRRSLPNLRNDSLQPVAISHHSTRCRRMCRAPPSFGNAAEGSPAASLPAAVSGLLSGQSELENICRPDLVGNTSTEWFEVTELASALSPKSVWTPATSAGQTPKRTSSPQAPGAAAKAASAPRPKRQRTGGDELPPQHEMPTDVSCHPRLYNAANQSLAASLPASARKVSGPRSPRSTEHRLLLPGQPELESVCGADLVGKTSAEMCEVTEVASPRSVWTPTTSAGRTPKWTPSPQAPGAAAKASFATRPAKRQPICGGKHPLQREMPTDVSRCPGLGDSLTALTRVMSEPMPAPHPPAATPFREDHSTMPSGLRGNAQPQTVGSHTRMLSRTAWLLDGLRRPRARGCAQTVPARRLTCVDHRAVWSQALTKCPEGLLLKTFAMLSRESRTRARTLRHFYKSHQPTLGS